MGGTAERESLATSITIVFQRASERLPSSPCGEVAAIASSARAAAAQGDFTTKRVHTAVPFFVLVSVITAGYGSEIFRK